MEVGLLCTHIMCSVLVFQVVESDERQETEGRYQPHLTSGLQMHAVPLMIFIQAGIQKNATKEHLVHH